MEEISNPIQKLIAAALSDESAKTSKNWVGPEESLLRTTAEVMRAEGCAIWQVRREAPRSPLPADEEKLSVLASWFKCGGIFALHDLPVDKTCSGQVVRDQKPRHEEDVRQSGGVTNAVAYFDRYEIGPMCAAPLHFPDGGKGTLNVYRKKEEGYFTDEDAIKLAELAKAVPLLYQSCRDRVSLFLLNEIDEHLRHARVERDGKPVNRSLIKQSLQEICIAVQKAMHSSEVSIYLKDPFQEKSHYSLHATTWKAAARDTVYDGRGSGITNWVLRNRLPVHLYDLQDFLTPNARDQIEKKYPSLEWRNQNKFPATAREKLGLKEKDLLPPLSFMAAPVLHQDRLWGVVRCCTPMPGPYYFSDRDLKLLEMVASRIGEFWGLWINSRELQTESSEWEGFVKKLTELDNACRKQLSTDKPDEDEIYSHTLRLSREVIPGATINGIRRLDERNNELYYELFDKASYNRLDEDTRENVKTARFSLTPPYNSAGALVAATGTPVWIPDITLADTVFDTSGPFAGRIKCALIAPIKVGDTVLGTLDLRGDNPDRFPRHASEFAELIGGQLGLFLYSSAKIKELQKTRQQAANQNKDLAHQLRGPIIQIQKYSQLALKDTTSSDDQINIKSKLMYTIRGLSRKAWSATLSMKLLNSMHTGDVELQNKTRIIKTRTIKRLIELCQDFRQLSPPDHLLDFEVEERGFSVLDDVSVTVDLDLFGHALSAVLDNAFKYSSPSAMVRVTGAFLPSGKRFAVSVSNRGIPISRTEVAKCAEYGYRGAYAKLVTGEGSGIGLWLVSNIMRAHKGDLLIQPTDDDGRTTVRLVFPTELSTWNKDKIGNA